jgi:Ca-activated chloride channel family protein
MTLAQPTWFVAWGVVVLLALLLVWASRRSLTRWRDVFGGKLFERVAPKRVLRRRSLGRGVALLGLGLLVVGLAEPRYGKAFQTLKGKGADVIVLLDLSRSMAAEDVDPSRMERARREIMDFLDVVEGDRIGLVVYAGGAIPRMPLTVDHGALKQLIQELSTKTFVSQGSALDAGLRSALGMLEASDTKSAGQAIFLLSDGEVHRPDDALVAAKELEAAGVRVYAMGVGNRAVPIPNGKGGFVQDRGEVVVSDPDPSVLREVARITGGAYVDSNASSQDIRQLYEQEMRGNLQAVEHMTVQREVWNSGYQWPLALGFMCLLFSAWLGDGRKPLQSILLAVLVVSLGGVPAAHAVPTEALGAADQLYRAERFDEAARELTDLMLSWPEDPDLLDRLGAARYRAGDFEGASRAWDEAARFQREGPSSSAFNSANAHYQAGRLEEALERYDKILAQTPTHPGAVNNRGLVAEEMERRRLIQPPPPPPPQEGEGEESESEGGEDPSDPQEGEQQGESSEQEGDPSQDQSQSPEGSPEDAEDPPEGEGEEGSQEPQDAPPQEEGQGGMGTASEGPITEGEAHRLFDSVEEGSQEHLVLPGAGEDKPW